MKAGAPEFNQQTIHTSKQGQIELIIRDVSTIFTFISWIAIKFFEAGELKVTRAVPEKYLINFFGLMDYVLV